MYPRRSKRVEVSGASPVYRHREGRRFAGRIHGREHDVQIGNEWLAHQGRFPGRSEVEQRPDFRHVCSRRPIQGIMHFLPSTHGPVGPGHIKFNPAGNGVLVEFRRHIMFHRSGKRRYVIPVTGIVSDIDLFTLPGRSLGRIIREKGPWSAESARRRRFEFGLRPKIHFPTVISHPRLRLEHLHPRLFSRIQSE